LNKNTTKSELVAKRSMPCNIILSNVLWKVDEEFMASARDLFVSNITSWKPEEIFVLIASSNVMASASRTNT